MENGVHPSKYRGLYLVKMENFLQVKLFETNMSDKSSEMALDLT